ncbi:MAG: hypothetical protein HUK00_09225 [Bacteroidaceae bacterium]|nr:hypothetical protein [Bacteroidaceae bacterium]
MTSNETLDLLGEIVRLTPYDSFRHRLYNADELYDGYVPGDRSSYAACFDGRVYQHYVATGTSHEADEVELVARVLHDNAVARALRTFLHYIPRQNVIGIMGGHGLMRTSDKYREVVFLSKRLTEGGALMVSGGGPGAMEATHLGAWMAGRTDKETDEALRIMSAAPSFSDEGWIDTQMEVMNRWRQEEFRSLGIPTWTYGHEPPALLATHIAKFFDNSIREDIILSIAIGGLVFAPGSAGTLQEAFQEAVQNHYLSLGISSPMVFFGRDFWTNQVPVYTLMRYLMDNGNYRNLRLTLSDDPREIVATLESFRASCDIEKLTP